MEKIELSLSPKYVTNWGLKEAIREILQNAIDCETDGLEVSVDYYSKKLIIKTVGNKLLRNTLLLGESGKNDGKYIGKYGEGYKLALLVLTRLKKETKIYTNNEMWIPVFQYSEIFGEETLTIIINKSKEYEEDVVVFEINDIEQHEMVILRKDFIALDRFMGREIGAVREGKYGFVLLNEEYKGNFFVNGLFVQSDTEFNYGYDFKSEFVNLDRDRKAINYYDLKELTAKALTSCGDVSLLVDGFKREIVDLDNEDEVLGELSEEQSINFKKHYYEKYKLDEDVFVGTDKMIEISGKEKTKKENEIVVKILYKADGKENELKEIKEKIKNKNDYDSAIISFNKSVYKKLYVWFKINCKNITKEAKINFLCLLEDNIIKPYGFDLIKKDINKLVKKEIGGKTDGKKKI